jgi:hypothetical protein
LILELEDIADSFGTSIYDFDDEFISLYNSHNWSYNVATGADRDKLIIEVLEFLKQDVQKTGDNNRITRWENGWRENLEAYKRTRDVKNIIPKFIRPKQPIRLKGEFVFTEDPNFELNYVRLIQKWIFHKYMGDCTSIHEFGCGSGINISFLSEIFPQKKLFGYDFVQSSIDIINMLSDTNPNIKGFIFDMTRPSSISVDDNSCVFTFCSIEQLSNSFRNFINFVLESNPKLCVHIEPIVELYNPTSIIDYTAICFHKQRDYVSGLLPYLQDLCRNNKIELTKVHRMQFGSLRSEGYMQLIWRPK